MTDTIKQRIAKLEKRVKALEKAAEQHSRYCLDTGGLKTLKGLRRTARGRVLLPDFVEDISTGVNKLMTT